MRKLYVASLILLTSCNQIVGVTTPSPEVLSVNTEPTLENAIETIQSVATVQFMSTQFLYVFHHNSVKILPIDSDGELIFPDAGYYINPAAIIDMKMTADKKFLYAVSKTSWKYYVYALRETTYPQEYTSLPVELISTGTAGQEPQSLGLGDNNLLFVQVYDTQAQKFEMDPVTGLLTYKTSTVYSGSKISYNAQYDAVTQVENGNHTYAIDSQTNMIIHYIDGVIQSSRGFDTSGVIKSLAIR